MPNLENILALNRRHEVETSALTAASLRALIGKACFVGSRGDGADGFLIALDQDADYPNANFRWFKDRHWRFVYVDRIVVGVDAQGKGLARSLYEELFSKARQDGHDLIGCEINSSPPNPGSDAFHARMGFEEVGHASLGESGKRVRYLVKRLTPAA